MAPFPRGALVRTWFDEGCGPGGYVYGVVTKAGPRTFTVRWESGIVQRRHQGCHACSLLPAPEHAAARKALDLDHGESKDSHSS